MKKLKIVNKNKIGFIVIIVFALVFQTFITHVFATPASTIVIGDQAYDLSYANNPSNISIIQNTLIHSDNKVFIKMPSGKWINNNSGQTLTEGQVLAWIPSVLYTANGIETERYLAGDRSTPTPAPIDTQSPIITHEPTSENHIIVEAYSISSDTDTLVYVKVNDSRNIDRFQIYDNSVAISSVSYLEDKVVINTAKYTGDVITIKFFDRYGMLSGTYTVILKGDNAPPTPTPTPSVSIPLDSHNNFTIKANVSYSVVNVNGIIKSITTKIINLSDDKLEVEKIEVYEKDRLYYTVKNDKLNSVGIGTTVQVDSTWKFTLNLDYGYIYDGSYLRYYINYQDQTYIFDGKN